MSVERAAFLAAMRGVANSVAVVTTDGMAGRHGATVTSFCSVSADPPSILVCLKADSRIARCVTGNGEFCVNVLDDAAAVLADRFAGRDPDSFRDRFAGVTLVPADGSPLLADAVVAMRCRLVDARPSGTHVIVVGDVLTVQTEARRPLAYFDGRYASLARDSNFAHL